MSKVIFLIPVLALTVSCLRKPAPIARPEPVPVPTRWSTDAVSDGDIVEKWWTEFQAPALNGLIEEALTENHDLKAAARRIEIASAQADVLRSAGLPSLQASWQGTRTRQNFIGFPIPGAERQVLSRTFTSLGVSLDVSWEADLWGRIGASQAAGIADYRAAGEEWRGARLSLVGQVSKAWFGAIETQRQLQLAQDTAASYVTTAERIRARYEQGLTPAIDLRLALTSVASAEALVEQRRRERDQALRQLEILAGRYPAARLDLVLALPEVPAPPPAGLPAEVVSRRPDLRQARARLLAADARWVESQKALLPSLALTANNGTSSRDLLDLLDGDFYVWGLFGNLVQPIFEGGRLRAEVAQAESRSEEAVQVYAARVLFAFAEVETALSAEQFLRQQETALQAAATQARGALRLANQRYMAGLEPIVTVLEAQRRALDADSQVITARRLRLDNRVDLHLALGGGFDESDQFGEKDEAQRSS